MRDPSLDETVVAVIDSFDAKRTNGNGHPFSESDLQRLSLYVKQEEEEAFEGVVVVGLTYFDDDDVDEDVVDEQKHSPRNAPTSTARFSLDSALR